MNTTKPKAATKIPKYKLIRNISATPNGISQRPVFLPTDIYLTSFASLQSVTCLLTNSQASLTRSSLFVGTATLLCFASVGDLPAHQLAGVTNPFLLIRRNSHPPSAFKPTPFFPSQSNPNPICSDFNILLPYLSSQNWICRVWSGSVNVEVRFIQPLRP